MNKLKFIAKILAIVVVVYLFVSFRISNIDFHCAPKSVGVSYCHLAGTSTRLLEGVAALIPESTQVQLGGKVAVLIPDLITVDQSSRATQLAGKIYDEMSTKPGWAFVHSSLGFTYEKMLHFQGPATQYYVYVPKHAASIDKLPVLLFLHGYGGDFTSYLYLLSQAADTAGFAIVAPTYKQGSWDADSIPFIQKVLTEAGNKFPLDTDKITLMGISNGGLIIPNVISHLGDSIKNVVILSSYMELGQYTTPEVLSVLQNAHKLVMVYGAKDERIDANTIPTKIQKLAANGVNAYYSRIDDEDHFLFFSQPGKVQGELLQLKY